MNQPLTPAFRQAGMEIAAILQGAVTDAIDRKALARNNVTTVNVQSAEVTRALRGATRALKGAHGFRAPAFREKVKVVKPIRGERGRVKHPSEYLISRKDAKRVRAAAKAGTPISVRARAVGAPKRLTGKSWAAAHGCPVPHCKGKAAPVFGMVCANHKDLPKGVIRKFRETRRKAAR